MKLQNILTVCALVLSAAVFAQNRTVEGTVTYGNVPVNGLKVSVQGTAKSVLTDAEGHYAIEMGPKENKLVFTGDGIVSQYVNVKKKQTELNVDVALSDLDLAIAKGYVDRTRINNSVGIITTTSKDADGGLSMKRIIEGRVPGVVYNEEEGYVYIRGEQCALYMVDGTRVPNLTIIDPGVVDKVEVVKDGTASVYGGEAYNGVVLITTKK